MSIINKREEFWAGVLARYEEVKKQTTQKEFAKNENVNFHAFTRRYQNSQQKPVKREKALVPKTGPGVLEVDVVDSSGILKEHSTQSWLEAEVPSGIRVRFTSEANSNYVAHLMRQIAGLERC